MPSIINRFTEFQTLAVFGFNFDPLYQKFHPSKAYRENGGATLEPKRALAPPRHGSKSKGHVQVHTYFHTRMAACMVVLCITAYR